MKGAMVVKWSRALDCNARAWEERSLNLFPVLGDLNFSTSALIIIRKKFPYFIMSAGNNTHIVKQLSVQQAKT